MRVEMARCIHGSVFAMEAPAATRLAVPFLDLQFPCGCRIRTGAGVPLDPPAAPTDPLPSTWARRAADYTPRAHATFVA